MCKHKEYFISSEVDGLPLSILETIPQNDPQGIIQLVHGMSEHKERYLPFMEYLTEHGYICIIHDHRGHGKSIREEKDLGYMYGGGSDAILKDLLTVNTRIRQDYPGLPLILFGHSMGALAVKALASENDRQMDALIISGLPANNSARKAGEMLAFTEGIIRGNRHKSVLLEKMSFASYRAPFKKEGHPDSWICSDPEVYKAYGESDLCGFTFTDDGYKALFGLMKKAYDMKHWKCSHKDLPILFVSGSEDPCMGNIRCFSRAVHGMRYAGYTDVKGKIYKNMRHEILNEKDHRKVFDDILAFIHSKGL